MTTQSSATVVYNSTSPLPPYGYQAIITQEYYRPNNVPSGRILPIKISIPQPPPLGGYTVTIFLGDILIAEYTYDILGELTQNILISGKCLQLQAADGGPKCDSTLISAKNSLILITIVNNTCLGLQGANIGDVYELNFNSCLNGSFVATSTFRGKDQFTVAYPSSCIGCQCLAIEGDKFQVPQIQITAQSTIEGTDVGEAIFVVCDEYQYYDNCKIPHNTCKTRYVTYDKVKQTKFNKCCPYMVSVVRGKGLTLNEKVTYLYNKYRINVPFNEFYGNIILYGMTRYVLAKLLWGKFDIDYLLNKYTKEFFHDLKHSRFCNFIEFFDTSVK